MSIVDLICSVVYCVFEPLPRSALILTMNVHLPIRLHGQTPPLGDRASLGAQHCRLPPPRRAHTRTTCLRHRCGDRQRLTLRDGSGFAVTGDTGAPGPHAALSVAQLLGEQTPARSPEIERIETMIEPLPLDERTLMVNLLESAVAFVRQRKVGRPRKRAHKGSGAGDGTESVMPDASADEDGAKVGPMPRARRGIWTWWFMRTRLPTRLKQLTWSAAHVPSADPRTEPHFVPRVGPTVRWLRLKRSAHRPA